MQFEFQDVTIRITNGEHFRVRIGDEIRSGDLYYLGIDPRNKDHNCATDVGLARLIDGWIDTICGSPERTVFYLPFDFSDEYTRWLACEKNRNTMTVVFGWAPVEGWAFSPSEFQEYSQKLDGFQADEPVNSQTFYTPRFLSNLRSSRSAVFQDS